MSSSSAKPRRVKSARARLTPTQQVDKSPAMTSRDLTKEAQERVLSAKAIRDKHNGSTKVFPRPESRASKERFSTVYSKDFEGSFAPAAELRPTSPTRRHNPHPGKVSKISTAINREGYSAPPTFPRLLSNSWYGDCLTGKSEPSQIQWASNYLQNTSPETAVAPYPHIATCSV